MDSHPEGSATAGTAGGTVLVLLTLSGGAVLETMVLAVIGAVVSFSASLALKAVHRWWRRGSSTRKGAP